MESCRTNLLGAKEVLPGRGGKASRNVCEAVAGPRLPYLSLCHQPQVTLVWGSEAAGPQRARQRGPPTCSPRLEGGRMEEPTCLCWTSWLVPDPGPQHRAGREGGRARHGRHKPSGRVPTTSEELPPAVWAWGGRMEAGTSGLTSDPPLLPLRHGTLLSTARPGAGVGGRSPWSLQRGQLTPGPGRGPGGS